MTSTIRPIAHPPDDNDVDDDNDYDVDWDSAARDIQNRVSRVVGTADMEDRLFRSFFGTSIGPTMMAWDLLVHHSLLPEKGRPKHLLWALYFLKVYPKQGQGCSVVGAVDPKTFRKWVWAFIGAIADLVDEVVSKFFYSQCEDDGAECSSSFGGPQHRSPSHRPQTILTSTYLREEQSIFFSTASSSHPPPRRCCRLRHRLSLKVEKTGTS